MSALLVVIMISYLSVLCSISLCCTVYEILPLFIVFVCNNSAFKRIRHVDTTICRCRIRFRLCCVTLCNSNDDVIISLFDDVLMDPYHDVYFIAYICLIICVTVRKEVREVNIMRIAFGARDPFRMNSRIAYASLPDFGVGRRSTPLGQIGYTSILEIAAMRPVAR